MTAAEEQLVAELAEAALAHRPISTGPGFIECACRWVGARHTQHVAAQVLPVVLADRRRAVAEALREIGREIADNGFSGLAGIAFARADAVEGGGR